MPATHQGETAEPETWATALGRFEETVATRLEQSAQTARLESAADPPETDRETIDSETLEEPTITVGTALHRRSVQSPETPSLDDSLAKTSRTVPAGQSGETDPPTDRTNDDESAGETDGDKDTDRDTDHDGESSNN